LARAGKNGAVYKNYTGTDKSKLIADFQDDESWSSGAGTQTDDSTNYRLGSESIKIADNDNSAGLLYSDLGSLSLNLAQFESGAASDTSDYIIAMFYVSDASLVTNVILGFDIDSSYDGSDAYTYTITSVVDGWNYVKIKKSAFTGTGMPTWLAVCSIRVGWTSKASASGEYVSFQALYLVDDAYDIALVNKTAYTMEFLTLVYNWTQDIQTDVKETTSMLQAGVDFKTFISVLGNHTENIERYWSNGDFLGSMGDSVVMNLYVEGLLGYRYDCESKLITDSIQEPVDDLVQESLQFQGTGETYYVYVQIIDS